jgi:hypothetical protein
VHRPNKPADFHRDLPAADRVGPMAGGAPDRVRRRRAGYGRDRGFLALLPVRPWLSYRRADPVTTISTSRLPHREQTSRSRHSETVVSAPYSCAISAASGSTCHTMSLTCAAAALPSVIGGPGAVSPAALRSRAAHWSSAAVLRALALAAAPLRQAHSFRYLGPNTCRASFYLSATTEEVA